MYKAFGLLLVSCSVLVSYTLSQASQDTPGPSTPGQQASVTIEGLVRDVACPIQNQEATATHLNIKCLRACARKGSPLVILTDAGELYFPISSEMPDRDQRSTLRPFLGKYVRAKGTVFERKGTRAIMISSIEELKDVHLTIDDQ